MKQTYSFEGAASWRVKRHEAQPEGVRAASGGESKAENIFLAIFSQARDYAATHGSTGAAPHLLSPRGEYSSDDEAARLRLFFGLYTTTVSTTI